MYREQGETGGEQMKCRNKKIETVEDLYAEVNRRVWNNLGKDRLERTNNTNMD
jgi:hypothetical protein